MKIHCFTLGPMGTNCYVVSHEETKACFVADPGAKGEAVADWLRSQGLTPKFILLTHGHFDHMGGIKGLLGEFPGLPVYLHPEDTKLTGHLSKGLFWTDLYEEGDVLDLDGISITVLHTPGHTPGSVCLQMEDVLLTGDTLFAGSCGRTDFEGGSYSEISASLRRLAALPGNCQVLPGHGEASDLDRERRFNPYMKEAGL